MFPPSSFPKENWPGVYILEYGRVIELFGISRYFLYFTVLYGTPVKVLGPVCVLRALSFGVTSVRVLNFVQHLMSFVNRRVLSTTDSLIYHHTIRPYIPCLILYSHPSPKIFVSIRKLLLKYLHGPDRKLPSEIKSLEFLKVL